MRKRPYHTPTHFGLDWKDFVTTPWTIDSRGPGDAQLIKSGRQYNTTCMHRFPFDEIIPCSTSDRHLYNDIYGNKIGITYELKHDGSGEPYQSIVDLRRDKIRNFLDVANFDGVAAFLPMQFEYMASRGTSDLINEIEKLTGLQAKCVGTTPKPFRPKDLDKDFVAWMNKHVDWETEKLIGYYTKRDL